MEFLSITWLIVSFVTMATSMTTSKTKTIEYFEGRLGGAPPSADYLRENSHILRHSSTHVPDRSTHGSSNYTPETYRRAVYEGKVYWGGHMYGWSTPEDAKMPTICTNLEDAEFNSTGTGYFICPKSMESLDAVFCCGEEKREYCCDKLTAKVFFYTPRTIDDNLRDVAFVFAILGAIFLPFVLVIAICLCVRG